MPQLSLNLLGHFQAFIDDQPLPGFRTNKVQALLVYLAAEPQPHSRESLIDLLWPDMLVSPARHNLRQVLYYLREAVPELASRQDEDTNVPVVLSNRQTIQLHPDAVVTADISQFRLLLNRSQQHDHADLLSCAACSQDLESAVALYRGDFLADFFLADSSPFESWAARRRAAYLRRYLDALRKLGSIYLAQGQFPAAEAAARKQIEADDLQESAHRQLMEVLARTGRRSEALAHYDVLRGRLWDELGVAPEQETISLVEQIEREKLSRPAAPIETIPPLDEGIPAKEDALLPGFLVENALADETKGKVVARERELSHLQALLEAARDGRGRIVFVTGGAGRGKTTLVREFSRRATAADSELLVITGNCAAITGIGDPYLPFREALAMLAGDVEARWSAGLITQQQAKKLWSLMPVTLAALVKHGPDLIHSFFSGQAIMERAASWAPEQSALLKQLSAHLANEQSSGVNQQRIFAQYAAVLKAIAAERPVLLIVEDLHWVDVASSGLLFHLSRELGNSNILLVGTYRPEEVSVYQTAQAAPGPAEQHPLAGLLSELKRQHGDIWLDLDALAGSEGRQFVDAYLDRQPNQLAEPFRAALFRQTGGYPLFTVELLQAMQERGDLQVDENGRWVEGETIDWTTLPLKVEGVIERRIKQLDQDLQDILTAASVEGETFTAEVVARVQQLDQRLLAQLLSRELDKRHQLVTASAAEWIQPGRQRVSTYRFRHQLFQHYLYHRLDEVERAYLHEAVGFALEQLYEGRTKEVAGQLAHHFQRAGLTSLAIDYLQQAGEAAAELHAYVEALAHYTRAVTLAEQSGKSKEEIAHLYTRLGALLLVTRGDWAPEVGQAYGKAYALYQELGESAQLFAALRGLSMYHRHRGEMDPGRQLTQELVALAQRLADPILIVEASFALGSLLFFAGEHTLSQTYLEQGVNNYDIEQHRPLLDDQDPGVALLSYSGHNLWLLGYPDRALQHCDRAVELAEELAHPYSLAMALIWSCWTQIFRWETEDVLERSEAAIRLSAKHDFPLFAAIGTIQNGWALARQGQIEAGSARMRQGLAASAAAVGSDRPPSTLAVHFAGVYRDLQPSEIGETILANGLAQAAEYDLHLLEAELHRLKGEMVLANGGSESEVEDIFLQALDIARRQEVKSLELRVAMSLSRLWRAQGKREQARRLLAETYDWFSEGFDTLDLIEARTLLEELS